MEQSTDMFIMSVFNFQRVGNHYEILQLMNLTDFMII